MNRIFKAVDRHGAEVEFELIEADLALERESEMQYRIAYSIALKEGILPREKMRQIFKENGIWNEDDEKVITNIIKDISTLQFKLEDATKRGDKDECIKIAGELAKNRLRMWQLFMVQQSSYVNSCEGYAELIRLESLMASCVVIKANKQRYWKTYKDYILERDHNGKATVALNAMELRNQLADEEKDKLIQEYPEQKWLKQVHMDILEKAQLEAKDMIVKRAEEAVNGNKVESRVEGSEAGD